MENAISLIKRADALGFDAVKFQKRNPELYPERPYTSPLIGECTYREHKRALELSENDYYRIDMFCRSYGIQWFASCFDIESVDFIARYEPKYWKIASPCITDLDLVDYIARQHGTIIMSTGMSDIIEVDRALSTIQNHKPWDSIYILHCNSEYPTKPEHVNLKVIQTLKERYPLCHIGYSSHDAGVPVPVTAVAMGAEMVEVHVTLDRAMPGSDHAASLELTGMDALARHVRAIEKAMGVPEKQFYDGERIIREKVSRRKR